MIGTPSVSSVPAASSSPPLRGFLHPLRRAFAGGALLLALASPADAAASGSGESAPGESSLPPRAAAKGGPVPAVSLLARKELEVPFPMAGQPVRYTITLSNVGIALQGDNPGPELVDVLPPLLTLTSGEATSGTLALSVGSNTVTWNGSIPGGGSVTITIEALIVPSAFEGQVVSNQGTIHYDADANGTNESTGVTDTIRAPGSADPTVFAIQGPDTGPGIPALSAPGLALLALVLAGLGVALLRRRGAA